MVYILDTHALVWYVTADKRLGQGARTALESVDAGDNQAIIPIIVFGEILYLEERKRISVKLDELIERVKTNDNYVIAPLTLEIVNEARKVKEVAELFDRMIVATALVYNGVLVTRDLVLRKAKEVETVW
ncbi:MAG: type II toxin-antitoxin system VapC family toxin [Chloroflexi bacterium]|nr:type II toxin-antitoxin system VapC family toxin [Chloroflexota bacterium]